MSLALSLSPRSLALATRTTLVVSAALAACDDGAATAPPAEQPAASLRLTDAPLAPGGEWERCFYVKLDNTEPVFIRRFEAHATGMHHLVVHATDATFEDGSEPCFSAPDRLMAASQKTPEVIFSMATGTKDADLALPGSGVIRLEPHQQLVVDLHVINVRPEPIDPSVTIDMFGGTGEAPADSTPISYYFINDTDVHLPAGPSGEVEMACTFPFDVDFATMATHMHTLGDSSEVAFDDGPRAGEVVHASGRWDSGELTVFDPPLHVPAGQTLRVTCHYDGHDGDEVVFGPSYSNEMCQIEGYVLGEDFIIGGVAPIVDVSTCTVLKLSQDDQALYRQIIAAFGPNATPTP